MHKNVKAKENVKGTLKENNNTTLTTLTDKRRS